MGYRLNCLDEPVFMAVPKPMLTEFGIHHRLESCVFSNNACVLVRLRANMKWENVNSIIWSAQHSDGRGFAVLFLEVTGCSMFYNHESGNHVSALSLSH